MVTMNRNVIIIGSGPVGLPAKRFEIIVINQWGLKDG